MKSCVISEGVLDSPHGRFKMRTYRADNGMAGAALWTGSIERDGVVPCRVHSSCFTSETLGALDCDCAAQLNMAMRAIATHRRGVVFYLLQEGRGAGLSNKARDRAMVQSSGGLVDTFAAYELLGLLRDPRSYGLVPQMCADLGIRGSLALMTNNPDKLRALEAAGLTVETITHDVPASQYNAEYLLAKVRRGHSLSPPAAAMALVPQDLEAADPRLERVANFRRVASYDMPVQVARIPRWFRATVYAHERTGHERIILSYRRQGAGPAILRVFREDLLTRLAGGGETPQRLGGALVDVVDRGAGCLLVVPCDANWLASPEGGPTSDDDRELLRSHARALGAVAHDVVAM